MSEQTQGEASRSETIALVCPACGAAARRAAAHFCATCGRGLRERTYAPADSLLASYHQQHSRPAMLLEQEMNAVGARCATGQQRFAESPLLAGGSALVVVILAFVPFIGILFCPFAVVIGAMRLRRAPDAPAWRRVAVFNIVCAFLISGSQAFWWGIIFLFAS